MDEVELKLLLDEAGEARLRRAATAAGRGRSATLLTRYFDTPDGALGRAGIALRLRREGRRWVQTVKVRARHSAGLSAAREAETPAPGGRLDLGRIADGDLRERVETAVNGDALAPVFETEMRRTRFRLLPDGASEVELAIDAGEIRSGARAAPHREAEFELVSGDPAALFLAARQLMPAGGVVFSTLSKAERGARLAAEGQTCDPAVPRKAAEVAIDRGMTAETAGEAVLAECLDQIAGNARAILASDDPEGPHQLRVGLRRLRTAFRLWREPFDGLGLRRLGVEAHWLGCEVGRLRDLDVAICDLLRPAAARAEAEPGFAPLLATLGARAEAERAALRATLAGPRMQAFLFDLAQFIALRGWLDPADHAQTGRLARPATELAAAELGRIWARTSRRARGIDHLDIEARHELRKALKGLRYAIEFLGPLYPAKRVGSMLKPLRALQEIFGNLNDLAMAEALFMAPDGPAATDPATARAAGRVIGARAVLAEEDWAQARARWRALKKVKPFWA